VHAGFDDVVDANVEPARNAHSIKSAIQKFAREENCTHSDPEATACSTAFHGPLKFAVRPQPAPTPTGVAATKEAANANRTLRGIDACRMLHPKLKAANPL
jgi:hypothetical protein